MVKTSQTSKLQRVRAGFGKALKGNKVKFDKFTIEQDKNGFVSVTFSFEDRELFTITSDTPVHLTSGGQFSISQIQGSTELKVTDV